MTGIWCLYTKGYEEPSFALYQHDGIGRNTLLATSEAETLGSGCLDANVIKYINENAELTTDDSTSYVNFKNIVNSHMSQVVEPKNISKVLPWVHIVISNAKRLLLDIYHDIKPEFLQNYLNEFCFKFNRRTLDLFDRLVNTAVSYKRNFFHRYYAPAYELQLVR